MDNEDNKHPPIA